MKTYEGVEVYFHGFLTSALDGVSGQLHDLAALPPLSPRKRSGIHWIGGWEGPRAGLDAVVKRKIPVPCRESNSDVL
jgi:hypothetical protein